MFQTFCDLINVMWNANAISEDRCENLVERCVRRPEDKDMYGIQRNARGLFLHENPWDRLSRGPNFAKLRSECVTEKSSMCCGNRDGR